MAGFRKATKAEAKLRLAVFGPSGAGKTYTSLRIASGLGGQIGVLDSERGSASKYADRFDFMVCEPQRKTIDAYCGVIKDAADAGLDILVIDSLSHAWQELLEEIDQLAKAKYRGNTWSAWSDGTPKQRKLVDAILTYPGHVIATMRSKTEWAQEKDDRNGKTKPVRVGLAPEQGKGIEYEFDMLMELSVDHIANVIKDRTGRYQDVVIEKPGEDLGRELAAWLAEGVPMVRAEQPPASPDEAAVVYGDWLNASAKKIGMPPDELDEHLYKWACQDGIQDVDSDDMTETFMRHRDRFREEAKRLFKAKKGE